MGSVTGSRVSRRSWWWAACVDVTVFDSSWRHQSCWLMRIRLDHGAGESTTSSRFPVTGTGVHVNVNKGLARALAPHRRWEPRRFRGLLEIGAVSLPEGAGETGRTGSRSAGASRRRGRRRLLAGRRTGGRGQGRSKSSYRWSTRRRGWNSGDEGGTSSRRWARPSRPGRPLSPRGSRLRGLNRLRRRGAAFVARAPRRERAAEEAWRLWVYVRTQPGRRVRTPPTGGVRELVRARVSPEAGRACRP